eukprot:147012-Chlamydomonas_euryale.AAC.2
MPALTAAAAAAAAAAARSDGSRTNPADLRSRQPTALRPCQRRAAGCRGTTHGKVDGRVAACAGGGEGVISCDLQGVQMQSGGISVIS